MALSSQVTGLRVRKVAAKMPDCQILITTSASPEYEAVTQLRYRLFLEGHGLPVEKICEADREEGSTLFTLVLGEQIIGCGRITRLGEEGQLSHIAVDVPWQGFGYGNIIMNLLVEKAEEMGLKKLIITKARITARDFYMKFGFIPVGDVFPSPLTGLPHVRMEKIL